MLTSFRHDSAKRLRRRQIIIGAVILVTAFVLLRSVFLPPLASLFHTIARPIWVTHGVVGGWFSGGYALVASNKSLIDENTRLRDELAAVALEAYTRDQLKEENDSLKEMLGRPREEELILATILARPERSPYDTFVIDIGKDAGLDVGWKVYTDGDLILGDISAVYARTSVVRLYSSSGRELPVMVGSSTPISATAYGLGGGNFRIALPRGAGVNPGDIVTVPALGIDFAGVVERVETPESSSFAIVYFKIPVNWNTIRSVYIAVPVGAPARLLLEGNNAQGS